MTQTSQPLVVVMGVSGSGKSTVGAMLAQQLEVPFVDADDLHTTSNVDKMGRGVPLTDADRWPWLVTVGDVLAQHDDTGVVVACSSLRRSYRDVIRSRAASTVFVYLHADRDVLVRRLSARQHHFMPASLLDSQVETLEPLQHDERGIQIDVDAALADIVSHAVNRLRP